MASKTDHPAESQDLRVSQGAGMVELYRPMLLMRRFEEKLAAVCESRSAANSACSYAGEEAVAAGAISALSDLDYVVSTYRQQSHYVARGGELAAAVAKASTRMRCAADGRGAQLLDRKRRFTGAFGPPQGGLGVAMELAIACLGRGDTAAVCCLFGDAALGEDAFARSLVLAAERKLPIVFVCENNFCGFGTQFDGPDCQETLYRFAESHQIPAERVDGGEVREVYRATAAALERARSGGGPTLIDAVTYRLRREPGFDRADAVGLHHPSFWHQRDPLRIARDALIAERTLSMRELDAIERRTEHDIDAALATVFSNGGAPRAVRRRGARRCRSPQA
jgi:TPP-dependent pyruvate/acetoin dehydrogenase alpha subunit